MKIKCIAVDDEPLALDLLIDNISKVPFLELIGTARNGTDALGLITANEIDLIFIDIQMPKMTGLELAKSIKNNTSIVFITAYKEFAIEGFDVSAIDYLLKPVKFERFVQSCLKVKELHELRNKESTTKDYFFLNADYSQVKIIKNDILYIEGLRDYLKFHFKGNPTSQLFRTNFKYLEIFLDSKEFVRIHKSYLIPISAITSVKKSSVFIDKLEFPIGDAYKESVEKILEK
jgi:DNA-binding LytR/AlgR family response regulator